MSRRGPGRAEYQARGFTLIEVLVALAVVALGMGAVMTALSSSAGNLSALREKTLAQWVGLNQMADTRLNLQAPTVGTTEGDVRAFGNGDWHWQQQITKVDSIPGLLEITVRVRRTAWNFSASSSSGTNNPYQGTSSSGGSSASSFDNQNWLVTLVGFRGDALAAASGETPAWDPVSSNGTSSSSGSSSGGSSSGLFSAPSIGPGGSSGGSSGGSLLGPSSQSLSTHAGSAGAD